MLWIEGRSRFVASACGMPLRVMVAEKYFVVVVAVYESGHQAIRPLCSAFASSQHYSPALPAQWSFEIGHIIMSSMTCPQ